MVRWATERADSHGEGLPASIEYLDALTDVWCALKPFLLHYSEYRSARELAEAVEATWLWDALIERADALLELERGLET